jgi:hypothetical protein
VPPTDPFDPAEPSAGQPDAFDFDLIDIGVAGDGGAANRPQVRAPREQGGRSPARVLAALVAVVAVAALLVGLFSGEDQAAESPLPSPTVPPEVLGNPARPAPTATVQVPVVSDGLLRAGETCRISLDDDGTQVVFTVPDGRTMRDCASAGTLLRDPGSDNADLLGSVRFSPQPLGLTLNQFRGDPDWSDAATLWSPVDDRRAYRLRRVTPDLAAADQLELIQVPGGTLIVTGRNRDFAPHIPQAIGELVDSIRVEGPDALPAPPLPQLGGWCGGDHFVTEVPAGWFAGERCRWLNSSSESPIVLQCECLPPLWIESVDIPFDGDFAFTTVDIDRLVTRSDNSVIRIIEGLRPDSNNMDRPLRAVIVDGGVKRVVIVATEFPEHALPGHTWERTLDAQQFLLDNLRFHSQPGCEGESRQRLVIDAEGQGSRPLVTGEQLPLRSGTVLETTGCIDGVSAEFRLVGAPEVVGWIEVADLSPVEVTPCPSGEREFRPHQWLSAVVGDFDGDGRDDGAYVRGNDDGGSDIAVLFANGGLAEATGLAPIDELPVVERIVGIGNDLLQVVERRSDRGAIVTLLDASSCQVVPVATHPIGFVDGARHGRCIAADGPLHAFRAWSESFDDRQGWVVESDRFWFPEDGNLTAIELDQSGAPNNLCGPVLAEYAPPVLPASIAGGELAGQHELTLQWIETRDESTGSIEFTPIGNDRYEVDGVHEAAFGFLSVRGVLTQVDETTLEFDGTISSQIPWLNRGEPCIRKAGQRFMLRTDVAAQIYRLQDRINCDGARTDWIDIRLNK